MNELLSVLSVEGKGKCHRAAHRSSRDADSKYEMNKISHMAESHEALCSREERIDSQDQIDDEGSLGVCLIGGGRSIRPHNF